MLARDLGDCRENEFKFVERIWTRYFPAEPVKISRKKEKCSYECTDNSKTDIKDVANRKNPLHGTGGNARRRRSRIDVFLTSPLPFCPRVFYKIDLSEVPVLIGAFAMGPLAGAAIELIKILLNLVMKGSTTAGVGEVANFLIGCAYVMPAAWIYKTQKTKKNAMIGMAVGTVFLAAAGGLLNAFVLLPAYAAAFGMPMDALVGMGSAVNKAITSLPTFVLFAVVPFNIIKGVVVSLVTMLLYKHISRLLKGEAMN